MKSDAIGKQELFDLSRAYWHLFMSFLGLITAAKTLSTISNKRGESGHLCLVPDFRGNAPSLSPFNNAGYRFIVHILYYFEVCFYLFLTSLELLSYGHINFGKCLSVSLEIIM